MRVLAALVLLVLSPFVGEYLLGNIPPDPGTWAFAFLPLLLLYGGGALLIREIARRADRGYPTMVALAVAYGLIEEGVILGTLFNRDYLGLGLLEKGYIPQLGTSPVWSVYVIGIHSVWSILVPIVLTEHLFPARRTTPWLPTPGLIVVVVIYLAGAGLVGFGNFLTYHFFASPAQLTPVAVLVAASCAIGLGVRRAPLRDGSPPAPLLLAGAALLCGSAFIASQFDLLPAAASLTVLLVAAASAASIIIAASLRHGWTWRHRLAATTGAVLTYCWAGFQVQLSIHGLTATGLAGQTTFAGLAIVLLLLCRRQTHTFDTTVPAPSRQNHPF